MNKLVDNTFFTGGAEEIINLITKTTYQQQTLSLHTPILFFLNELGNE